MSSAPDFSRDRGFLLGDGLFETVRLYQGHPFRLREHLSRLETSARRIRLGTPQGLVARVEGALAEANFAGDGSLRITLTRGPGPGLLPPDPPAEPTLCIQVRPLDGRVHAFSAGSGAGYEVGIKARILGRVDETALTVGIKGIGSLERVTALLLAREAGAHEALLRNGVGRVVTGSASNLFFLRGRTLGTPRLEDGILPGITRQVVLELAEELGLGVELRAPGEKELLRAEEVFLTSSIRELAPVVQVEGEAVGSGRPGPVFRALSAAFRDRVVRELESVSGPRSRALGSSAGE